MPLKLIQELNLSKKNDKHINNNLRSKILEKIMLRLNLLNIIFFEILIKKVDFVLQ